MRNPFGRGLEELSPAERRAVRRAISRGERLGDRRLSAALLAHVDAYFDDDWRFDVMFAAVAAVLVCVVLVGVAYLPGFGGPDFFSLVGVPSAVFAAQVTIGRRLRQKQYESARRRHEGLGRAH